MQACKESIEDKRCNLKILDPELRESLIQLDKLKQGSRNSANRKVIGGNVQFFTDSIWSVNSNIVKLLGGSTWRLDSNYYLFASQEMIGIKNGSNSAVFYVDGNTSNATLVAGIVSSNSAILTDVISSKADGRFLKLSNGMVLEFDSYDAYDTGWWLPSYPVLVESSGMNMWNLNKGKKVWIKGIE